MRKKNNNGEKTLKDYEKELKRTALARKLYPISLAIEDRDQFARYPRILLASQLAWAPYFVFLCWAIFWPPNVPGWDWLMPLSNFFIVLGLVLVNRWLLSLYDLRLKELKDEIKLNFTKILIDSENEVRGYAREAGLNEEWEVAKFREKIAELLEEKESDGGADKD